MKNPWRGLLSYSDPDTVEDKYQFCGRNISIGTLFTMIDSNLLVTLYGKTGIGKTSILNAGVFPLLRSVHYQPVSIRLGECQPDKELAGFIVGRLTTILKDRMCTVEANEKVELEERYKEKDIDYLWYYFHTHTFYNDRHEIIFPVIVLDQFEEIFHDNRNPAKLLLKQIYALINDNKSVPDFAGYAATTNFRFLLSLREDDLFYLEDAIDINHLVGMKQNRYRLCPLTEQDAREVVYIGKKYIEKGAEEKIADRIINLSKDENGHISTNILSLVCSQLFIQSQGILSAQALDTSFENPLKSFYDDCMSKVTKKTRQFIENKLIEQDRRRFVSITECHDNIPTDDFKLLMHGEYSILHSVGNSNYVELIHDILCPIVKASKEKREQDRQHKKKIRNYKLSIGFLGIVLVALVIYSCWPAKSRYNIFLDESGSITEDDFWRVEVTLSDRDRTIVKDTLDKTNNILSFEMDEGQTTSKLSCTIRPLIGDFDPISRDISFSKSPNYNIAIGSKKTAYQIYGTVKRDNRNGGSHQPVIGAIVIWGSLITRTDYHGQFHFQKPANDSITSISDSSLIIVKEGYSYSGKKILDSNGTYMIEPRNPREFASKCALFKNEFKRAKAKYQSEGMEQTAKVQGAAIRIYAYTKPGNDNIIRGYYSYGIKNKKGYYIFGTEPKDYIIFEGIKKKDNTFTVNAVDDAYNKRTINGVLKGQILEGEVFFGDYYKYEFRINTWQH